jgi:hypothetical protein
VIVRAVYFHVSFGARRYDYCVVATHADLDDTARSFEMAWHAAHLNA